MATQSMSYDHPAYTVPINLAGQLAATASSGTRFGSVSPITVKSLQVTVATAGGTANTIQVVRYSTAGTTTLVSNSAISTSAAGVTTNLTMTAAAASCTLVQGDFLLVEKGSADGTGIYAFGIEVTRVPGSSFTV